MNNDVIIDCPYCETRIFIKKFKKIRSLIYCYNCEEPIIPKKYFLYEFFYFLFNAFIFALIIAISAYSFENYSEWKNISGFVFLTSLMIASLALHEFFHAFFAYIFGDYSVFSKGYLRLNIFKYIHGIHSIIMPLAFLFIVGIFSPGAAVYINEDNIKYRIFHFIVDVSGIFSQIIFCSCILFLIHSGAYSFSDNILTLLHTSAFIQVLILFFNLLPIPGLDGWNAIFSLLSKRIGNSISHFLSYPLLIGFIACILWVEEFTTLILSNVFLLIDKLGLDKNLIFEGYSYIIIIDTNTLVLLKDRLIELFLVIFKKMDLILG